jgi:hypothetical protein
MKDKIMGNKKVEKTQTVLNLMMTPYFLTELK